MRTGAPVEIIEVEPVWLPSGEPVPASAPSAPVPVAPGVAPDDVTTAC